MSQRSRVRVAIQGVGLDPTLTEKVQSKHESKILN